MLHENFQSLDAVAELSQVNNLEFIGNRKSLQISKKPRPEFQKLKFTCFCFSQVYHRFLKSFISTQITYSLTKVKK